MTSRPGPARSAGGPRVNAALSRFGDVVRVFDYRAGRLDGAADGPSQGKAGLDRDPLTRWAIAADPKLHHFGATLADKPADGQQDGPGRQALAPPGRRHTEDKPDRARTPADQPDHADRPWALGDRQQERGPVIAVFASPPGQPVGDRPQAALPRRAGIKRRQLCLAQTAVLPGGVADKGICIPGRRDTQRYDAIGQDALRRPQGLHAIVMRPAEVPGRLSLGRAAGAAGRKVRIDERAPPG